MKYLKNIVMIMIIMVFLTGCGKIKNSKSIVKHFDEKYDIDVEVISFANYDDVENKNDRYSEFVLKEKDRDVTFNAKSFFSAVGMDGSTFWHQEHTSDDYYECLTYSLKDDILAIEKKYNLEFDYSTGLISKVNCHTLVENEDDLQEVLKAINEIMKLYNLKKLPNLYGLTTSIYIYSNDKDTSYYSPYTINGAETQLIDGDNEFRERWDIPEGFEEIAINYINQLYSGEGYIVSTTILPAGNMRK